MLKKLTFIEDLNYKNLKDIDHQNNIYAFYKSICVKDNLEYYCERVNIDGKNGLLKSNNFNDNIDLCGFDLQAEDPKLCLINNKIFIIFNILNTETWGRTICISDYENFCPIRLSIKDEKINNIEKNWTPFVKDNKLFFIYSYDPLIVLSYDFNAEGVCNIIYKENNTTLPFDFKYIRGSSNLIQLCDEYYIGFVHSTIFTNRLNIGGYKYPYYVPFLIIIDTKNYKITYLSEPISFNLNPNEKIKTVNNIIFDENEWHCVIYPTSINKIKEKEYLVSLFINDRFSLKYKLEIDFRLDTTINFSNLNEHSKKESVKYIKKYTKYSNDEYL